MSELDEPPFMRDKIRICEHCKGNLLIQSLTQIRKHQGRDEKGEIKRKYTPGTVTWWCPSCARSVNTKLIDGWISNGYPYDEETESPIEDSDYYEMTNPFPTPNFLGFCIRGKQQYTIEQELQFTNVKSPFITRLAEKIMELKLIISEDSERNRLSVIRRIEKRRNADED